MDPLKSHLLLSYQLLNLMVAVQQAVMFDFIMQNKTAVLTHHLLYEMPRENLTTRTSLLQKKQKQKITQSKPLRNEQALV